MLLILLPLELLLLLGLGRAHHAVIVLGMLEIVFRHDAVTRGVRVAGELQVLLVHVRCRAANLHLRSVGIERPVGIAAIVIVLRPAAASTRALHEIPFTM